MIKRVYVGSDVHVLPSLATVTLKLALLVAYSYFLVSIWENLQVSLFNTKSVNSLESSVKEMYAMEIIQAFAWSVGR